MSTLLNNGRNDIPLSNSNAQCLLENWVEERAVKSLEPYNINDDTCCSSSMFKDGHIGLITTEFDAKFKDSTTHYDHFRNPLPCGVRVVGKKQEMMQRMLWDKFSQELYDEKNGPPEISEYMSETHAVHNVPGFRPSKPIATAHHDYRTEQPVTCWTDLHEKIHGKTQDKGLDTPFRRNAEFTEQKDEFANTANPYDTKNAPYSWNATTAITQANCDTYACEIALSLQKSSHFVKYLTILWSF